jgi:arylsulfatase A-like enzyme
MKLSRLLFSILSLAFGSLRAIAADAPASGDHPNVIFILADDLGRGDYSAFGTKDIRTPNIDRIFHEGMTFENFYANSPVCSPSRAAILSGCYPDRVGVPGLVREETPANNWGWLSPKAKLLPVYLKPAGYHSGIVGKWNLGLSSPNIPPDRGFDETHAFLGDMMDDYYTHLRHGLNLMRHNRDAVSPKGHATEVFTGWACDYLQDRAKDHKPFFLYLAYNAPHDPIQPPQEWLDKVRAREPNMSEKRTKLVALIEHMDSGIGQVLDVLDKTGLAANTIVVMNSDNGGILANGANNGPWRGEKQHMYEGGLRVPCGARWPGHIKAGSKTERIALGMDWFPTIVEAAGQKPPDGIDGHSLLGTLLGTDPETGAKGEYYFVRREGGPQYGGKTIEALRKGDWKLLQDSPFAPQELYNLKDDPREEYDMATKAPKVMNELRAALRVHVQIGGAVPWQAPEGTLKTPAP